MDGVCVTHRPMNILPQIFCWEVSKEGTVCWIYQAFWDVIPYCLVNAYFSEEHADFLFRTVAFGLLDFED